MKLRMEASKRATVYFDASVHQALRLKGAATDRSISDLVNDAVKVALAEDAEDLASFDQRKSERSVSFDSLVRDLRKRGRMWAADQAVGRPLSSPPRPLSRHLCGR
jgi:hypothetical protein